MRVAIVRGLAALVAASFVLAATAGGMPAGAAAAAEAAACRSVPVEADAPLRSAIARERFGVDGTGVTVGVISDSFTASTAITTPADDVAAGVLPGPGNPCGRSAPVRVLSDNPSGSDEGRAMLQLVHGIAPGARLLFASGGVGRASLAGVTAAAIDALAAAGADVIVDDVSFPDDVVYQSGIVSAAVERAKAEHGILYLTSASNSNVVGRTGSSAGRPIGSWGTTAYRPMPCPSWVSVESGVALDCQDFDPAGGADPTDGIELVGDPRLYLHWGEAYGAVASGFELQVYGAGAAGGDPVRMSTMTWEDPALRPAGEVTVDPARGRRPYELVIVRTRLPGDGSLPAISWLSDGGGIAAVEHVESSASDTVGPTATGHQLDGSAISIGAAPLSDPRRPESFSAIGSSTLLFGPVNVADPASPSLPLPVPREVVGPVATALDDVRTSFFAAESTEDGHTVYRFPGTSAAAPLAAGVAALAKQYDPGLTQDTLRALLARTSAPMVNPYAPFGFADASVFGGGLIDAEALLAALPAPATPVVRPVPMLAASGQGDAWRGALGVAALGLLAGALLALRARRRA